ncbi:MULTISPECIES: YkvA family protein [Thalassospira]|jgi:hypothetical protein|uniref:DUF1232 domain-containing protein n=1 Tax=Thalassospira xiamenensis TaxID=220697 RepID=A0ABR5Y308_9PROT|nr:MULTISPECIES: DUF1232 domain-containing protein [Thalassospira]KZD04002.1 hypothetical protein AUP40_16415 [Thalassospira xiamenensis]KZD10646.1 hypothetical protein AUP45_10420 [Thalassospira xiamenensis]MAB32193.1 DUF1232 domain-containing protein [Thalassospira sp.]MAL29694.1 DUF1232 domain-containing protein [Thalassospira sp.]MBA06995.1 DUF1232 domain-containing protein [Thalassospira sp.]|tara:strand:- start:256 stop:627 length:372 start_codon:yes stop_codon:yes gene_type:complete
MAKPTVWAIIPNLLRSLFRPDVPLRSKFLLLAGIIYLVSPIDLLPDVIAGIGWIDDLVIVPLLGWLSYKSLPPSIKSDMASDNLETPTKSRKWLYLLILILALIGIVMLTGPDDSFLKTPSAG